MLLTSRAVSVAWKISWKAGSDIFRLGLKIEKAFHQSETPFFIGKNGSIEDQLLKVCFFTVGDAEVVNTSWNEVEVNSFAVVTGESV